MLGEAKFYSLTYRLFKLPEGRLETLCEDYGQYAVYKGTIDGHPNAYSLDDHHRLEKGKPLLVCGNTASMLGETWLGKHRRRGGQVDALRPLRLRAEPGGGAGGARGGFVLLSRETEGRDSPKGDEGERRAQVEK